MEKLRAVKSTGDTNNRESSGTKLTKGAMALKIEEFANGNINYDRKTQHKAQKTMNLFDLLCHCRYEPKWERKKS
jgi:hypothetical protein